MATDMAPSDSTQVEGSCCHRNIVQFCEIKDELKSLKQTVDVAVKLLTKLVGLTPDSIQTLVNDNLISARSSKPFVNALSVVSDTELTTDMADECMDVTSKESAFKENEKEIPIEDVNDKSDYFIENKKYNIEARIDRFTCEAEIKNSAADTVLQTSVVENKNDKTVVVVGETNGLAKEAEGNVATVETEIIRHLVTSRDREAEINKTVLWTKNFRTIVEKDTDGSLDVITTPNCHLSSTSFSNSVKNSLIKSTTVNIDINSTITQDSSLFDIKPSDIDSDIRIDSELILTNTDRSACSEQLLNSSVLSEMSPSILPSSCDFNASVLQDICTSVVVESVLPNNEAGLGNVKVKQEKFCDHDNVSLSVSPLHVEERSQHSEEVKMDPEGMFISDEMLPVCVLMKKEEEFCNTNTQENCTAVQIASNTNKEFNSKNSGGISDDELIVCSVVNQGIGHTLQDCPVQVTPPLRPLFGSALVSKLKQKIQEKIQAAVGTIEMGVNVNQDESESDNLTMTNKSLELSLPLSKDCKSLKTLKKWKVQQKFYQCKICAKVFFCKIALHAHKKHCKGLRKQYYCSSCPLMFKSRAVLFNHRRLHSKTKSKGRHKCELCGREFILKSTLKKHRQSQICIGTRMKCYRKLPQYFCIECGEGFLNSSNLALHKKLHKVDNALNNNKTDRNAGSDNQTVPMVVSRKVRRYPCGYCDEAFIDRRSVTLHEKLHTDKEFAAFDQERRMIQRRHHLMMMMQKQQQQKSRKKYDCNVCGRCYPIELLLHMHTRLHHAIS